MESRSLSMNTIYKCKSTALMTMFLFVLSLASPLVQAFAFESNFYDGPGGYAETSRYENRVSRGIDMHSRIVNRSLSRQNKIVGMALGGAVGGGLVLALGLAASPILAAATVIGSVLAGGFVGSQFGNGARNVADRATSSSNFMSWAGGLAGGALGFMIPGGSVLGAAIGAGLGGAAGNALSDNKHRIMDLPSRMMRNGMMRMGGGFMGPVGPMMEGPMMHHRMMAGTAPISLPEGFYAEDGRFVMSRQPNRRVFAEDGTEMDWRSHYIWHDDNGDLAYPGWENDLYRQDNSASIYRTSPGWTTGLGSSAAGRTVMSGGSAGSIENPSWGDSTSSSYGRRGSSGDIYSDGDVYSSYVTSDGETFNPGYEAGSTDSLVGLSSRYKNAVEELRSLTAMGAPAIQREEAHREVQRLERLLHNSLR